MCDQETDQSLMVFIFSRQPTIYEIAYYHNNQYACPVSISLITKRIIV